MNSNNEMAFDSSPFNRRGVLMARDDATGEPSEASGRTNAGPLPGPRTGQQIGAGATTIIRQPMPMPGERSVAEDDEQASKQAAIEECAATMRMALQKLLAAVGRGPKTSTSLASASAPAMDGRQINGLSPTFDDVEPVKNLGGHKVRTIW